MSTARARRPAAPAHAGHHQRRAGRHRARTSARRCWTRRRATVASSLIGDATLFGRVARPQRAEARNSAFRLQAHRRARASNCCTSRCARPAGPACSIRQCALRARHARCGRRRLRAPARSTRSSRRPVQKSVINDAGISFSGPHRIPGAPHRRAAAGDDAGRRRHARGARHDAPAAAQGQRRAASRHASMPLLRIVACRTAHDVRRAPAAHPGARAESACGRIRSSRPRGDRGDRAGARSVCAVRA